ncbi:MAG: type I methionyl aminopeptidase [Candidatus Curtissbacteria bacterium]|nr:type I methionyl aminopeptidase [Candidatus Curtissbacteria bacterium]
MIKTNKELGIMKVSGKIAALALKKILGNVRPGVKCVDLDKIAHREIKASGATSSFMTVDDYKWTICTTINDQVVHGIPGDTVLLEGDILGIDIGAFYKGFHSDLAISVPVGKISQDKQKFLEVGENTLNKAIAMVKPGARIGDISQTIQQGIEEAGYSIVKNLTGHGVGRELHEDPMIPGFGKAGKGMEIEEGMTLAIEVIYAQGSGKVKLENDKWTISTVDGSLGGLFEKTIAVTKSGPIVLTPYI